MGGFELKEKYECGCWIVLEPLAKEVLSPCTRHRNPKLSEDPWL